MDSSLYASRSSTCPTAHAAWLIRPRCYWWCLQDTEGFYTIVQQKILQRFGKEFTWELKAKMMGKKALQAAETLVQELGLEGQLAPEDFVKEREEMLHTMFPDSQLMPGAAELVAHLKTHNVRHVL